MSGRQFIDDLGNRHLATRRLSQGGEGTVFETTNPELAVKVLDVQEEDRAHIEAKLRSIQRFPLNGIPITEPLHLLHPPDIGYVMRLIRDMTQVNSLCSPPPSESDLWKWYLKGGGLRRRLRILARLAHALLQLHSRGLAFGDLTPSNVMATKSPNGDEIFLIDVDNLTPVSKTDVIVQTRRYAAPEVQRREGGISTLTDAHSFAVVAYQVLTAAHPLFGDEVDSGDPEMEDKARFGRLPWIGNKNDKQNASTEGLHPFTERLVSPRLEQLFVQSFEAGLSAPHERPSLLDWFTRLSIAGDRTIQCAFCGHTYYVEKTNCPYCAKPRTEYALAKVFLHAPTGMEQNDNYSKFPAFVNSKVLETGSPSTLTRHFVRGTDDSQALDVEFRIEADTHTKKYRIWPAAGQTFKVEAEKRPSQEINTRGSIPLTGGWFVSIGNPKRAHRRLWISFDEETS